MNHIKEEIISNILNEIENNPEITEIILAEKYMVSERTIRRYIKILKDLNKIKIYRCGKERKWVIIK